MTLIKGQIVMTRNPGRSIFKTIYGGDQICSKYLYTVVQEEGCGPVRRHCLAKIVIQEMSRGFPAKYELTERLLWQKLRAL